MKGVVLERVLLVRSVVVVVVVVGNKVSRWQGTRGGCRPRRSVERALEWANFLCKMYGVGDGALGTGVWFGSAGTGMGVWILSWLCVGGLVGGFGWLRLGYTEVGRFG